MQKKPLITLSLYSIGKNPGLWPDNLLGQMEKEWTGMTKKKVITTVDNVTTTEIVDRPIRDAFLKKFVTNTWAQKIELGMQINPRPKKKGM